MRPPQITGGNHEPFAVHDEVMHTSMRPPQITGGNLDPPVRQHLPVDTSMRPPQITGGNRAFGEIWVVVLPVLQ